MTTKRRVAKLEARLQPKCPDRFIILQSHATLPNGEDISIDDGETDEQFEERLRLRLEPMLHGKAMPELFWIDIVGVKPDHHYKKGIFYPRK